ncbi:hypothetical protein N431DRAFT_474727 [Stipitochalara longipes BDJ]|nr:hypothetical protein N431DRAFT_474727 [Stipitochalara longipes BDJ]
MKHSELLEQLSDFIKSCHEGKSDKMDPQLAAHLLTFVAKTIREEVYADPQVSSHLAGLRAGAAGQIDALKAHFEETKPELLQDAVKAAIKDAASVVNDEVRKMVRESVMVSFTAEDLEEIREEVKEELKNDIRMGLMDELRAELRDELPENAVALPHRPAIPSNAGKKRSRKPKGA